MEISPGGADHFIFVPTSVPVSRRAPQTHAPQRRRARAQRRRSEPLPSLRRAPTRRARNRPMRAVCGLLRAIFAPRRQLRAGLIGTPRGPVQGPPKARSDPRQSPRTAPLAAQNQPRSAFTLPPVCPGKHLQNRKKCSYHRPNGRKCHAHTGPSAGPLSRSPSAPAAPSRRCSVAPENLVGGLLGRPHGILDRTHRLSGVPEPGILCRIGTASAATSASTRISTKVSGTRSTLNHGVTAGRSHAGVRLGISHATQHF